MAGETRLPRYARPARSSNGPASGAGLVGEWGAEIRVALERALCSVPDAPRARPVHRARHAGQARNGDTIGASRVLAQPRRSFVSGRGLASPRGRDTFWVRPILPVGQASRSHSDSGEEAIAIAHASKSLTGRASPWARASSPPTATTAPSSSTRRLLRLALPSTLPCNRSRSRARRPLPRLRPRHLRRRRRPRRLPRRSSDHPSLLGQKPRWLGASQGSIFWVRREPRRPRRSAVLRSLESGFVPCPQPSRVGSTPRQARS